MKRSLRPLFGIGLPLLAIAAFLVLLTYSLSHLYAIQAHMRLEAPNNMLWVVSRAHVASLMLSDTAGERAAGRVEADELQRRHDVFLSSLYILDRGPSRRAMQALGFADRLDQAGRTLPQLQARITDLRQYGDADDAAQVKKLLAPYVAVLGQASTKAMTTEWEAMGGILDDSRARLWWIIISLAGILLAGLVLFAHAVLAIRQARDRTYLLNQEKAFSQLLIGSSDESIVAVDLAYQCTVWNMAAERLFQCSTDTAQGRPLGEASTFFKVGRIRRAINEALSGRSVELLDQLFFRDLLGEVRYLDLRCFALYEGTRIIGAILLIFDVTERRVAEREIAMHRDHLEELVHARTRELDASLERERAAAELYRNFGTMVSHQFRTPLSIIDSTLQRLVRRGDKLSLAEVRDRSIRARDAIKRMTQLIESTLDAGRLDAGQIEIHNESCDLTLLVESVFQQQCVITPNRIIELTLPGDDAPVVDCDPIHIEHILNNLLSNAIKYSDRDSCVSVVLRCVGDTVECAVTNQGVLTDGGDDSELLFERYFRGENTKGQVGTGIGLYMARALARLQSGDIRLDRSRPGFVTFILCLPRAASCVVADNVEVLT